MTIQKRRWYDNDPVLSKAMKVLESSDDKFQIQVAINLIKVIIEHNIQENTFISVDDIISSVEEGNSQRGNSRWYDIDKTLRTAIQMLENCPAQMQSEIAKDMANLVAQKFKDSDNKETD